MNWEALKGSWLQLRGRMRMRWGKLTDDQLDVIEGRREMLLGKLQEAYGMTEQQAEQQVSDWENTKFGEGAARNQATRRAI